MPLPSPRPSPTLVGEGEHAGIGQSPKVKRKTTFYHRLSRNAAAIPLSRVRERDGVRVKASQTTPLEYANDSAGQSSAFLTFFRGRSLSYLLIQSTPAPTCCLEAPVT
jgi:hypothetical protein